MDSHHRDREDRKCGCSQRALRRLPMKPQTPDVKFAVRDYRAADFDRLWQIDQLCFPAGVAYTQMELMGFIARRKAVTLVAEEQAPDASREKVGDSSLARSHIV